MGICGESSPATLFCEVLSDLWVVCAVWSQLDVGVCGDGAGGRGGLQPLCSVRFCGTLVLCCVVTAGCVCGGVVVVVVVSPATLFCEVLWDSPVLCCAGCDLGPRWRSDVGVWG